MLNIIKRVAKEVRSQLESHVLMDDEEGRYGNSDRVCAAGKCDIYSSQISDMLNENGVCATTVRGFFDGSDHFWTEAGELIVDVTVDQFGEYLPQILIGRYKDWPQYCLCKEKTAAWHKRFPGEP